MILESLSIPIHSSAQLSVLNLGFSLQRLFLTANYLIESDTTLGC